MCWEVLLDVEFEILNNVIVKAVHECVIKLIVLLTILCDQTTLYVVLSIDLFEFSLNNLCKQSLHFLPCSLNNLIKMHNNF